ncbi:MAG: phage/plasmid replication protein, II/X family [Hydrogenophaga sp.]|uniref:phage/plasmid replication protein, II/X family n=1 Tax=Hydrogenophaga sp. TaxID=1904254 RepID=UPI00271BE821|nr:phage/plasmid replication protein, II/X family [Hydrogenophaga sp.]MDO9482963.1 phage/plasmid replication protein, II/X family [Hydrogenophaga sp.]MDP3344717.1 phage/plasmid replication protein, II/X family [Hydrogenophaga sp.]MDP3808107.1 phage/plasmid replication protein, II/X family [Hydrogenophaga sp.]MDP3924266.1 phage/plasmid replication protein, II/X family [Hydrogenophaga sp.]
MAAVFAPDFLAPAGRDVHVTRHFSPTSGIYAEKDNNFHAEKPRQDLTQEATFCDWVSIYQTHTGAGLPVLSDGYFVRFDAEGTHEGTTLKKVRIEGSHETAIFIRSDGETVHFEGNVSKWGRPDNVFGYTFAQCIARINTILQSKGLPPFTAGKKGEVNTPNGWRTQWTGARITRLDLTENFAAGSAEDAYHFMRFLAAQQASRLKTGTHGQGETVDFGRGSRRVYSKAYLKGPELLKHAAKPNKTQTDFSKEYDPYLNDLANWCNSVGLVRFETTYKSTFLIDNGQQFLGGINMSKLEADFKERQTVFTRANCDVEDISSLDAKTLAVYRMWEAGDDITQKLSRSAFYRYRAALLPFGVDIAIKSNVIKFQPKTRVIKLEAVKMPDFYKMPPPSFVRLVA